MEYFELIANRESCRDFEDRPVEHEKLTKLIYAAGLAPSACNNQSWQYTVVENREKAAATAKCCQGAGMNKFADACPVFIIVQERKAGVVSKVGGAITGQQFAPIDIGLSVMQLCLAATELGLSTCILGWLNEKKLMETLPLNPSMRVRLVICVGYAAKDSLREKKRRAPEDIATYIV